MVSEVKGNAVKEFHKIPYMYFLPIAKYSGPKIAHYSKPCPSQFIFNHCFDCSRSSCNSGFATGANIRVMSHFWAVVLWTRKLLKLKFNLSYFYLLGNGM